MNLVATPGLGKLSIVQFTMLTGFQKELTQVKGNF